MGKISVVATGDYLPTRRIPKGDAQFAQVQSVIQKADAAITDLEITISWQEGVPNGFSGGTHVFTTPDRLEDLKAYGFNLLAAANNHCLDYGETGLIHTMKYLREYGLTFAGIGGNKAEAAKPAYLDTAGGRVALLSVASSLVKPWYPEEQRADMIGRPGANGLPCHNDIRLSPEQYEVMKQVKEMTQFNNLVDMMVDQGFVKLPENMMPFGFDLYCFPLLFRLAREGEEPGMTTYPEPKNMARLVRNIQDAKLSADTVIVNLHGHEMKGKDVAIPADFHGTAAKAMIDAGADAIVIQGCHQVRGVEIYKGKPIFYSLGNFVFQNSTLNALPQSFYNEHSTGQGDTYDQIVERRRQNPEYLMSNPLVMTSVFAGWHVEDGAISDITLYPIDLHVDRPRSRSGFPSLSGDQSILDRVIALSTPFGTKIEKQAMTLDDGSTIPVGKIKLD